MIRAKTPYKLDKKSKTAKKTAYISSLNECPAGAFNFLIVQWRDLHSLMRVINPRNVKIWQTITIT